MWYLLQRENLTNANFDNYFFRILSKNGAFKILIGIDKSFGPFEYEKKPLWWNPKWKDLY